MFDSILNYGQYRYLKNSLLLIVIAVILYLSKSPGEPPNGGTWQGYTLGAISAALILFLLWFGIRKRQYHRTESSLAGWASAHVYLGISLPIVASLHCGFQFDWNVHTFAYTLMALVVLSGFYGLYAYLVYPTAVTTNRDGTNRREMITTIAQLDETGLKLAEGLGAETHHQVLRKVVDTQLGGTLWQQITAGLGLPSISFALHRKLMGSFSASKPAIEGVGTFSPDDFLYNYLQISQSTEEINQAMELLKVLNERQSMVSRVQRDIRYHTFMKCWLLLHIPLSCALLAAVIIHVISVFFYW